MLREIRNRLAIFGTKRRAMKRFGPGASGIANAMVGNSLNTEPARNTAPSTAFVPVSKAVAYC